MFSNCIHKQIKWTPSQSQNSHFHADIAIISRDIQLWSLLPSNCSTSTRSKYSKFFSSLQLVQCDQIEIQSTLLLPSGQKRVSVESKSLKCCFSQGNELELEYLSTFDSWSSESAVFLITKDCKAHMLCNKFSEFLNTALSNLMNGVSSKITSLEEWKPETADEILQEVFKEEEIELPKLDETPWISLPSIISLTETVKPTEALSPVPVPVPSPSKRSIS